MEEADLGSVSGRTLGIGLVSPAHLGSNVHSCYLLASKVLMSVCLSFLSKCGCMTPISQRGEGAVGYV